MEKLLLYHLINGGISPNKIDLAWVENPLIFQIIRTTQKADKRGESLTESDLLAVLKATLGSSEYLKSEAILKSIKSIDTEVSVGEVISNLKTTHALTQVEGTVSEIAEAALGKDLELLAQKTKELQKSVSGTVQKKVTKMGEDIDNNIFMLPSSLPSLNATGNRLCGVTVITAPSGVGKSAFCSQECVHQWKNGRSSVYFSLELPAKLLEARILANLCEVPVGSIVNSLLPEDVATPLSKEDSDVLDTARKELISNSTPDIYIFDNVFDPSEISSLIREFNSNYGVELFVLDYLNLMASSAASDGSTWQSKANFVRDLNQLCLELGIVILLPSQADIERGTDGKLTVRTRGTSELLNSSSMTILIYRPPDVEGMLELEIVKARNATKCKVGLADRLDIQKFEDLGLIG